MKNPKRRTEEVTAASPPLKWGKIVILMAVIAVVFVGFAWILNAPPKDKVQVFIQPINATTGDNIQNISGALSWMLTDEELSPGFKFEGEQLSVPLIFDTEQYHGRRFLVIGVVDLVGYAVEPGLITDANTYMVNGTIYQPSSLVDGGVVLIQLDTHVRMGYEMRSNGSSLETVTIYLPVNAWKEGEG